MYLVTKIFKREDWYLTSKYGYRKPIKTSVGTTGTFHNGCDYGTNNEKWPQYAIENGYIVNCGKDKFGANYVWVAYPRLQIKLLHYHLDSVLVKIGQKVDDNTIIGYTGNTGRATGIHLHLGMKNIDGGNYMNPHTYNYIEASSVISKNKQLKIGDNVIANGNLYIGSNDLNANGHVSNRKTTITRYVPNTKHPYNTIGDLGWMNGEDLHKIENEVNRIYCVKRGDTLYAISKKFYGNGNLYSKIVSANHLKNPDLIYEGQKLIIP